MKKANLFLKLLLISLAYFFPINVVMGQVEDDPISYFRTSPRLVDSNTSFKSTYVRSRYNFIIDIPADADNNLATIVINQQQNTEIIDLYPEQTNVFLLTQEGQIPLEYSIDLVVDEGNNTSETTINLLEPVPSGSRIKVALRARNPSFPGIYQFGVRVYPQGENPRSLYLGIGRFHFYRNGFY